MFLEGKVGSGRAPARVEQASVSHSENAATTFDKRMKRGHFSTCSFLQFTVMSPVQIYTNVLLFSIGRSMFL